MMKRLTILFFEKIATFFLYSLSFLLRKLHPEWQPRNWSNAELRRFGHLFQGKIINVSGWEDRDKQGGYYSDYFPHKSAYFISNIGGDRGISKFGKEEVIIDLTKKLSPELKKQFNVVFNHTTLEHISDIYQAIENLCELSNDIIILIVPFKQPMHWAPGSYLDYWRFTPFALDYMFNKNDFEIIYCSSNDNPLDYIYLFCIATCNKDKWHTYFSEITKPNLLNINYPLGIIEFYYGKPCWLSKLINKNNN